jgi:hypothetical protein
MPDNTTGGSPKHIVLLTGTSDTEGKGSTVIVDTAVLEHPSAEIPVTICVTDIEDVTVREGVVTPVSQLYVVAPLALTTAGALAQVMVEVTVTSGREFTVTSTVAEAAAAQPDEWPLTE